VVGVKSVEVVKSRVHDIAYDTGRLHDSVSFATPKIEAKVSGAAEQEDAISKPNTPNTLFIGTACPYAWWVEHGSMPITDGSYTDGKFRDRIIAWAARHGIDEEGARRIAKKVGARGLPSREFMKPSEVEIYEIAKEALAGALVKIKDAVIDKNPMVVEVPITMTTTHVRSK
jgi:hypothetical protein